MLLDHTAQGVFAIAVTPFTPGGAVDYDSVDRMTDFYLSSGVTGLTILGIMGEAPKLDPAEALAISNQVVRRSKVPIIVGVSAPGFAAMRSLARGVMEGGAAGVMIAPPPSLRTDDQIVNYYAQAVSAIGPDIPFVIQDYPLLLSVVITPKVIQRIVNDNPSCVMLKHEDWPGLEKISALRKFQADGTLRPISILTGNGAGSRRRNDGLCVSRHAGGCRQVIERRPARSRARSLRRPPSAHPLRAAAGHRPGGSQVRPPKARSDRSRLSARTRDVTHRNRKVRSRLSPKPSRPARYKSEYTTSDIDAGSTQASELCGLASDHLPSFQSLCL
jgi:hypothetical protein